MNPLPRCKESLQKKSAYVLQLTLLVLPLAARAQQLPTPSDTCELSTPGRCIAAVGKDQIGILTSPRHIQKKDLKWILPLVAATGTAFAFDRQALGLIGTNPAQVNAFRTASNFTGIYVPVAGLGAAWLTGTLTHNDHLRETGLLAGEALADTAIFTEMLKYATNRERPGSTGLQLESAEFWPERTSYPAGDSFPSGHTAIAFAFAHVVADEYPSWEVKLAAYGLAAATAAERLGGREHFPSDVLVGGAAGYLIGGYVYNHHAAASKNRIMVTPMIGGGGIRGSVVFSFAHPSAQ